jgi:putative ABC transport system ATP-binding protein
MSATDRRPETSATQVGAAVAVADLAKTYGEGDTAVHALRGVSFEIDPGAFVVLLGASGSGKTTLLNLIGAIEEPSSGSLSVAGTELVGLGRHERTEFRRDTVGFVFQFFNLVPTLTAIENVELVAELRGTDTGDRSRSVLDQVGLGDRLTHFPAELSGGEQQRVAIARALVKQPPLLLTDEPTGALDLETGQSVLSVLRDTAREHGCTVLTVTHNAAIAEMADRVLRLRDGRIVSDEAVANPLDPDELSW